jgi:hypothetical protein
LREIPQTLQEASDIAFDDGHEDVISSAAFQVITAMVMKISISTSEVSQCFGVIFLLRLQSERISLSKKPV